MRKNSYKYSLKNLHSKITSIKINKLIKCKRNYIQKAHYVNVKNFNVKKSHHKI